MRYSEIQKKREPVSSCHDSIRADKVEKAVLRLEFIFNSRTAFFMPAYEKMDNYKCFLINKQ